TDVKMEDLASMEGPPMPGVTPHLAVKGASEASAFYEKAFGAQELMRVPTEDGKRLMHCHLAINGGNLMLCDIFEEMTGPFVESRCDTMHLQLDDVDAGWKRAVDAGCEITMPIGVQFWGDTYGQVRDPFGVHWSLGGRPKG